MYSTVHTLCQNNISGEGGNAVVCSLQGGVGAVVPTVVTLGITLLLFV